jgi:plasmid replication initiation protein
MLNSEIVTKHNALINHQMSEPLTFNEMKMIALISTMVQKDDIDFKEYSIKLKDFYDEYKTLTNQYTDAENFADKLMHKSIKSKNIKGNNFKIHQWFSSCGYDNNTQTFTLSFHPHMKQYYLNLSGQFTIYNLQQFLSLKNPNAMRLYEILKSRSYNYETIQISVIELREMLGHTKTYQAFSIFNQNILSPSIEKINKQTDMQINLKTQRTGRFVTDLLFKVTIKHSKVSLNDKNKHDFVSICKQTRKGCHLFKFTNKETKQISFVSINQNGMLYDIGTSFDFVSEKAITLWEYMFTNQDKINFNNDIKIFADDEDYKRLFTPSSDDDIEIDF